VARTKTLAQLRALVQWQPDTSGLTLRHSTADLNTEINQSIQRFREMVSDNGLPYYLTTETVTMPVGPTSPYAFGVLSLSAVTPSVLRVYGLDITVSGEVMSLDAVDFRERNSFQSRELSGNGTPIAFTMWDDSNVAILPASDSAYSGTLWYLPVAADLSADADTFDGKAGWETWIVWDVVHKLCVRDSYVQMIPVVLAERDRVQGEVLRRSRSLQRVGPMTKRDTRGEKRAKAILSRRAWLR
jgi:hypothetical protein